MLFVLLIGGRNFSLFAQSANPIQIENQNPGTSSWLITNNANQHEIEGYASLTSVNAGDDISFFVNTIDPQYTLTIYRLGYYGGLGGRQMTQPVTLDGIAQPIPTPDPTYGMVECQWTNPYVFAVPADWVSGVYVVKLIGSQSHKQRYITFTVRNDGRPSDLIFKSSVTTYQAYNGWGGKSLYTFNSTDDVAAVKVSYNRPYDDSQGAGNLLQWELDMLAFLEQEGYDVVYSTDLDTHESPAQLLLHKGFLSVGHDEYWSYEERQNVTAARDQGVSLGFFSADTSNWQIRFEPSPITGDPDRTQVGYKELWQQDPDASDPSTYYLITATFAQTRFTYPGHPEDALIGSMYNGKEPVDGDIEISDSSNWVFANTGLQNGDLLEGLLGYEANAEKGHQPANTILLAHSPYEANDGSTVYGDMTVYDAASGATVFSTGTVQWSWGLSSLSPWGPSSSRVDPAAQQITRNVLARFINSSATPTATPTASSTATATPQPSATATATAAAATPTPTVADPTATPTPAIATATPTIAPPTATPTTVVATPTPTPASPTATPTPGAVQITAPLNGATVSGTTNITVVKGTGVSWVNVYVDGNYFASTPPSTISWNTTALAGGSHTIMAKAFSSTSVVLGTHSITVTVQNGGSTATATATSARTATATAASTPTAPATTTSTPTSAATLTTTPTAVKTSTPTAVATRTATPIVTPTAIPTLTSTPTITRTATATSTRTATPNPTPISSILQITAPGNGATVSGSLNIVLVKGTGASWANVYIDGNYFASTPPSIIAWNSKTVPNGAHTISAKAYNATGTVLATASVSVTVAN